MSWLKRVAEPTPTAEIKAKASPLGESTQIVRDYQVAWQQGPSHYILTPPNGAAIWRAEDMKPDGALDIEKKEIEMWRVLLIVTEELLVKLPDDWLRTVSTRAGEVTAASRSFLPDTSQIKVEMVEDMQRYLRIMTIGPMETSMRIALVKELERVGNRLVSHGLVR